MTTLPTFIELLASLGLDEKAPPSQRHASPSSLRSSTSGPCSSSMECIPNTHSSIPPRELSLGSSPAIVIDAPDCTKIRSLGPSFRTRGARYAPYGAETVSIDRSKTFQTDLLSRQLRAVDLFGVAALLRWICHPST
jgi:hypothetical protein